MHRRSVFAHLRVEHHPDRFRFRAHRQRHSNVADDRPHDVATPSIGVAPLRSPPQTNRRCVDGFLAERSKAFALERRPAITDLAACEELLEPVVDGARQNHPSQDFATLVGRQGGGDRFTREESIARIDEGGARLIEPPRCRDARRGVRQFRDLQLSQRLMEAFAKHGPEGLDGCPPAHHPRIRECTFDKRQSEGELLEDESAKALGDGGSRRKRKGSSHLSKMVAFGVGNWEFWRFDRQRTDSVTDSVSDMHFKGWVIPGPVPPGAASSPDVPPEESLDAISGHYRIYQLRHGHRFSTDDVLTAWYGTTCVPAAASALDLGSGIGSVAMIAAWRLPGLRVVTVEAQGDSVRLARKSAAYNGLDGRFDIRHADFRQAGVLGADERFDLVLGSPPYFPRGSGIEGVHPQKVACRFELRGNIRDYARVAAAHLNPGGLFACVFPEGQRDRFEDAARDAALTIVRRRPVVFREGEDPLVSLFALMKNHEAQRANTWVEPSLVIRQGDGSIHPEYVTVKLSIGFPP
jgi:tRNA1Val (adenine37-N6)-methyltransferase